MKELYSTIGKYFVKPVLYTSLGLLTLTGCEYFRSKNNDESMVQNQSIKEESPTKKTYFSDWGFIDKLDSSISDEHLDLELGDFDGDGDLDIAVVTLTGGLRIIENRIPQKKNVNLEDDLK